MTSDHRLVGILGAMRPQSDQQHTREHRASRISLGSLTLAVALITGAGAAVSLPSALADDHDARPSARPVASASSENSSDGSTSYGHWHRHSPWYRHLPWFRHS